MVTKVVSRGITLLINLIIGKIESGLEFVERDTGNV